MGLLVQCEEQCKVLFYLYSWCGLVSFGLILLVQETRATLFTLLGSAL
jgi:hypothetical protein